MVSMCRKSILWLCCLATTVALNDITCTRWQRLHPRYFGFKVGGRMRRPSFMQSTDRTNLWPEARHARAEQQKSRLNLCDMKLFFSLMLTMLESKQRETWGPASMYAVPLWCHLDFILMMCFITHTIGKYSSNENLQKKEKEVDVVKFWLSMQNISFK